MELEKNIEGFQDRDDLLGGERVQDPFTHEQDAAIPALNGLQRDLPDLRLGGHADVPRGPLAEGAGVREPRQQVLTSFGLLYM